MLKESEIAILIEDQEVLDATNKLRRTFIEQEAQFIEISSDDFLSLVLLSPTIGVALANGSISLFEELTLNKKARNLSRGSYFLRKDPVLHAMKFLISNFDKWEKPFYELIKLIIQNSFKQSPLIYEAMTNTHSMTNDLGRDILNAPYILVKLISFFFLEEEDDLLSHRRISKVEFEKILDIGEHLSLVDFPVFAKFCKTFEIGK